MKKQTTKVAVEAVRRVLKDARDFVRATGSNGDLARRLDAALQSERGRKAPEAPSLRAVQAWAALRLIWNEQDLTRATPTRHAWAKRMAVAMGDLYEAIAARDITLPDGSVRHNVGSDNLSDEDRRAMVLTKEQVAALNADIMLRTLRDAK